MQKHTSIGSAFVLALTLTLCATTRVASAQTDTTRRAKPRVPVTKEQPPAPATAPLRKEPPAPTVDTLGKVSRGEVVVPRDTTPPIPVPTPKAEPTPPPATPAPPLPSPRPVPTRTTTYLFGHSGLYAGVGASLAVPYNLFSDLGYQVSYGMSMPIGWHRMGRTFGVRTFLSYDQAHAHTSSDPNALPALHGSGPDPKIYTATLDATLKFPLQKLAREGKGFSLYTVGGGGIYLFRGFGGTDPLAATLGVDKFGSSPKNLHKYGLNAGAGVEWGLGPTALFVESRYVNVFTTGSGNGTNSIRWIPIVAGVTVR
jgi:hypothetical protein